MAMHGNELDYAYSVIKKIRSCSKDMKDKALKYQDTSHVLPYVHNATRLARNEIRNMMLNEDDTYPAKIFLQTMEDLKKNKVLPRFFYNVVNQTDKQKTKKELPTIDEESIKLYKKIHRHIGDFDLNKAINGIVLHYISGYKKTVERTMTSGQKNTETRVLNAIKGKLDDIMEKAVQNKNSSIESISTLEVVFCNHLHEMELTMIKKMTSNMLSYYENNKEEANTIVLLFQFDDMIKGTYVDFWSYKGRFKSDDSKIVRLRSVNQDLLQFFKSADFGKITGLENVFAHIFYSVLDIYHKTLQIVEKPTANAAGTSGNADKTTKRPRENADSTSLFASEGIDRATKIPKFNSDTAPVFGKKPNTTDSNGKQKKEPDTTGRAITATGKASLQTMSSGNNVSDSKLPKFDSDTAPVFGKKPDKTDSKGKQKKEPDTTGRAIITKGEIPENMSEIERIMFAQAIAESLSAFPEDLYQIHVAQAITNSLLETNSEKSVYDDGVEVVHITSDDENS